MDILSLVRERVDGSQLKQVSGGRDEWASPCPDCGGKDRFRVFPKQGNGGKYWCRVCNIYGDVIQFYKHFHGMSYKEACKAANITPKKYDPARPRQQHVYKYEFKERSAVACSWGEKARALVGYAHKQLLSAPSQLAYLAGRGIPLDAVKHHQLGYLSETYYRAREDWGLEPKDNAKGNPSKIWIPAGIVVPTFEGGEVIRIRVRQREGYTFGDKYIVVAGSAMQPMVLNPEAAAFIVSEAELDGIASYWPVRDLNVGAIALGTLAGKPDAVLNAILKACVCILNALDFEPIENPQNEKEAKTAEMQQRARDWWQKEYKHCKRWPVPVGKDVGDAAKEGLDLRAWVLAGLPPVLKMTHETPKKRTEIAPKPTQRAEPFRVGELSADVQLLYKYLQAVPVWIDLGRGGFGIETNWQWSGWREQGGYAFFRKVQKHILLPHVFEWLCLHHNGRVVGCDNFLEP